MSTLLPIHQCTRYTAGRLLLRIALAMVCCAAAQAQRPSIQVEFHITDCIYRVELGAKLADAEQAFLPLFVDALQQRISFLQFKTTPQPYRLVVLLGDQVEPGRNCDGRRSLAAVVGEVRYHLKLILPPAAVQPEIPTVSWMFRGADDSLRGLSRKVDTDEKIRDVELVGTSGAEGAQPGELRRQFTQGNFPDLTPLVLSQIPVAEDGALRKPPPNPKWEVPLTPRETCLGQESRLRIVNRLEFTDDVPEDLAIEAEVAGSLEDTGLEPIRARIPDDPPQTQKVAQLAEPNVRLIKVIRVYVTKYVRLCSSVVPPAGSGLTGGAP